MAYAAEISRSNPACIVFMVDQSASMSDPVAGGDSGETKAIAVAQAVNRMIYELVLKCAKESGVSDYFEIAVIGFNHSVGSALSGALEGRDLVPLSTVAKHPARIDERTKSVPDGSGGTVTVPVRHPVWMEPVATGATRMVLALELARSIVERFVALHPDCYPPVLLNLTDGDATDGDPREAAEAIRGVRSTDGAALLFNLHLASESLAPVIYPDSPTALGDPLARRLYEVSSVMPPFMRSYAAHLGIPVSDATRGFVFNADLDAVVQFLDIGTRADDLR